MTIMGLTDFRYDLSTICEREMMSLFRLARRCEKHHCSQGLIREIKQEAWDLYNWKNAYPERILDSSYTAGYVHKFAFQLGGRYKNI